MARTIKVHIYSEKDTKFCEISTLLLFYVVPVKSKVEISQNFVAFSEYMNFTTILYVTANVLTYLLSFCRLETRYRNGVGIKAVRY